MCISKSSNMAGIDLYKNYPSLFIFSDTRTKYRGISFWQRTCLASSNLLENRY